MLSGGGSCALWEDAVLNDADKAGLDSGITVEGSEACRKKGGYSATIL